MFRRSVVLSSLVALAFAGCNAPEEPTTTRTRIAIASDEFHNGGIAGFVWLPPMVAPPAHTGDIVPAVPATVRVDELNTDGTTRRTVASFTTSAAGSDRVRVVLDKVSAVDGDTDPSGSFLARWSTEGRLATAPTYRVRVLVPAKGGGTRELGFADVDVVKNAKEYRAVDTANYVPLVAGDTLAIQFRIDRPAVDRDGDGVLDWLDNCPALANAAQTDTVGNGIGDACRCDGVVCEPNPDEECQVVGACVPTTGACGTTPAADGTACTLSNAEGTCSSGVCAISYCQSGYGDCDSSASNGCETNLHSTSNCGECGNVCVAGPNQSVECDLFCRTWCTYPFQDCDEDWSNGCETDTATNHDSCGACGVICAGYEDCIGGTCVKPDCPAGKADCDGDPWNGCEVTLASDYDHCGSCGGGCGYPDHTNLACVSGACAITSCEVGYADCNKIPGDGCEADLSFDSDNCGDCGNVCQMDHTNSASCNSGSCFSTDCATGYGDCNDFGFDGCETDLSSDAQNCGACGKVCAGGANATGACTAGACEYTCTGTFADCDDDPVGTGCESDLMTDPVHCGSCGNSCDDGLETTVDGCVDGSCWHYPAT